MLFNRKELKFCNSNISIGGLLEEIVCVVEDVRAATGMYTAKDTWAFNEYDLFFTNKRIIMAVVQSHMDWKGASTNELDTIATAAKKLLSYKDVKGARRSQFKRKTPDEILELHPESFDIPYENIKSIKFQKTIFSGLVLEIKVLLEGREKKLRFRVPKDRFSDIERVIDQYSQRIHQNIT